MSYEKMNYIDFIELSIKKLRRPNTKGIHSVFSGFNEAFRDYYNEDPIEVTRTLYSEGKIELQFRKGGVMIYLPGDAPPRKSPLDQILKD
jgi:hypothetical protein